mmetsp:Transcript_48950/g.106433  ORF Transcript_48950/g.106433 Transcript_48950/m.106433 type:complete len:230 (-) Transcript_48950:341-1030(-)
MLRGRATSTSLVHTASCQKRDNGEHLGARPELNDRKEIRVVISEDVAGDRNGVQALARPLYRDAASVLRGHDFDVQAFRLVHWQVLLHLADHDGIMSPVLVEPEDCLCASSPSSSNGEFDPILNGNVLGLAHAPDITLLDLMLKENLTASGVDNPDDAVLLDLKGLVVRSIFLGLLGHKTHVGHSAHGGGVKGAVFPAVVDGNLEDARIATVRDHRLAVAEVRVPGARL